VASSRKSWSCLLIFPAQARLGRPGLRVLGFPRGRSYRQSHGSVPRPLQAGLRRNTPISSKHVPKRVAAERRLPCVVCGPVLARALARLAWRRWSGSSCVFFFLCSGASILARLPSSICCSVRRSNSPKTRRCGDLAQAAVAAVLGGSMLCVNFGAMLPMRHTKFSIIGV
jgi:hypothetical protein